jgi:hypothetical protein
VDHYQQTRSASQQPARFFSSSALGKEDIGGTLRDLVDFYQQASPAEPQSVTDTVVVDSTGHVFSGSDGPTAAATGLDLSDHDEHITVTSNMTVDRPSEHKPERDDKKVAEAIDQAAAELFNTAQSDALNAVATGNTSLKSGAQSRGKLDDTQDGTTEPVLNANDEGWTDKISGFIQDAMHTVVAAEDHDQSAEKIAAADKPVDQSFATSVEGFADFLKEKLFGEAGEQTVEKISGGSASPIDPAGLSVAQSITSDSGLPSDNAQKSKTSLTTVDEYLSQSAGGHTPGSGTTLVSEGINRAEPDKGKSNTQLDSDASASKPDFDKAQPKIDDTGTISIPIVPKPEPPDPQLTLGDGKKRSELKRGSSSSEQDEDDNDKPDTDEKKPKSVKDDQPKPKLKKADDPAMRDYSNLPTVDEPPCQMTSMFLTYDQTAAAPPTAQGEGPIVPVSAPLYYSASHGDPGAEPLQHRDQTSADYEFDTSATTPATPMESYNDDEFINFEDNISSMEPTQDFLNGADDFEVATHGESMTAPNILDTNVPQIADPLHVPPKDSPDVPRPPTPPKPHQIETTDEQDNFDPDEPPVLELRRPSRSKLSVTLPGGVLVHRELPGWNLDPIIFDLIYWRNPGMSAGVLTALLLTLILLRIFPVLQLAAYFGLALLVVSFTYRLAYYLLATAKQESDTNSFTSELSNPIVLPADRIHDQVNAAVRQASPWLAKLRGYFLVESYAESAKFAVFLWQMTYIGSWISVSTMAILSVVAAFSIPKIYELKKTEIDQQLSIANEHYERIRSQIEEKLPASLKVKKTQ